MSVLASKRSESPLKVYDTARAIRSDVEKLLLTRFSNENLYSQNVITENGTEVKTKEVYPQFLVDKIRDSLLTLFFYLISYIVSANAIYPTNEDEFKNRLSLHNKVIETCFSIQAELNHCADLFPQQLHCLLPYADRIGTLTAQARKWKKKIKDKFAEKQKGVNL